MIVTLTKKSAHTGETLMASKDFNITSEEISTAFDAARKATAQNFGSFATIYVDPDHYTIEANGEKIDVKPQFWPTSHSAIINELTRSLS